MVEGSREGGEGCRDLAEEGGGELGAGGGRGEVTLERGGLFEGGVEE